MEEADGAEGHEPCVCDLSNERNDMLRVETEACEGVRFMIEYSDTEEEDDSCKGEVGPPVFAEVTFVVVVVEVNHAEVKENCVVDENMWMGDEACGGVGAEAAGGTHE